MVDRIPFPQVKVCGLTRLADVRVALKSGANALGFVLHEPSPRSVHPAALEELLAPVPESIARVAVLVETHPQAAAQLLRETRLNWIQLCGDACPEDWVGFSAPILRRIPVGPGARETMLCWKGVARGFVLDHPCSPGGSGTSVDWALARSLCAIAPCLLAGGLHGGNVVEAIHTVEPSGVDAASRLESRPGTKDPSQLSAYILKSLAALAALSL